jgi:hypothetical protein
MTNLLANTAVPDGKYAAKFEQEIADQGAVVIKFVLTIGLHKAQHVFLQIHNKKSQSAIAQRKSGWLEWLQFEGDTTAIKVLSAINSAIDGQFLVEVKDGFVKNVFDPANSETAYLALCKELSKEWQISNGTDKHENNLRSCKLFYKQTKRLPRNYMVYFPKEQVLANWLHSVINPASSTYFHDANLWVNQIYDSVGGIRENIPANKWDWPKLLLNTGFDKPPPLPKEV